MKIFVKILFFQLFIFLTLSGEATFTFDISRFYWSSQITEVEVNYAIPYDLLSYSNEEGKLTAPFKVDVKFENLDTGETLSDTLKRVSVIPSYKEAKERNLIALEQFKVFFKPSRYKLTINVVDINTGTKITKNEIFNIDSLPDVLTVSDIELATLIEEDTTEEQFTKNGLKVIPNPSRIFGQIRDKLYFYFEVYNLKKDTIPYEINYIILDNEGNEINRIGPKKKSKTVNTTVGIDVGALNLIAFKTGFYTLNIEVIDGGDYATQHRDFQVQREVVTTVKEEIPLFTEEEMKYYAQIEYIASNKEISEYKALNDTGKVGWLKRFWKKRDTNPFTPENEGLAEFIKRMKYVEDKYSTPFKQGYFTDRGRMYITYGEPDVIETRQFELEYKPYQIWEYYSFGGYRFIFSDLGGDGEYILIFSSTSREPTLPNWKKYVPADVPVMHGE